jgi:RNA polymerase sigma-70 factor (ECF subfamily)
VTLSFGEVYSGITRRYWTMDTAVRVKEPLEKQDLSQSAGLRLVSPKRSAPSIRKVPADEDRLVARGRRGDKKAFEVLVKRYHRRVAAVIYRIVENPDDAEVLTQEVFIKAYTSLASFQGESRFFSWIFRIAVNAALTHNKRKAVERKYMDQFKEVVNDPWQPVGGSRPDDPEQHLQQKQFVRRFLASLRDLPEEMRTSIILREFQDMNYREIAEVMDVPLNTVRSRLFRARVMLREILHERPA